MSYFGELRRANLRDHWQREDQQFTPWLADNLGPLGEALGLDLELVNREAPVGGFALDLLANDLATGGKVVIENQLASSNHDHLGKLLTYAAGYRAETVIWLAESFRDEHLHALEWLNQRSNARTRFFAVTVEVLTIDDSRPAYNFKVLIAPNDWQKAAGGQAAALSGAQGEQYQAFFQPVIDTLRDKHGCTNVYWAKPLDCVRFQSGLPGINYSLNFTWYKRFRVDLYIGGSDRPRNYALFHELKAESQEIENTVNAALSWDWLDAKQAGRVAQYTDGHIEMGDADLGQLRDWALERILAFRQVFQPRLEQALRYL